MRLKKILLLVGLLSLTLTSWSQDKKWVEMAYDDCGEKGKQPHLVLGENYEMPANCRAARPSVPAISAGR